MKTFLLIDTVTEKKSRLVLLDSSGSALSKATGDHRKLFSLFKTFFKTSAAKSLTGLLVINGPGEFSQARHGVAFANALSYSMDLPLKPMKVGEPLDLSAGFLDQFAVPIYTREPNITKPKK